jgi:chromosome segregation ATPase
LLEIEKEKKELTLLKLKTADMFRAKKDLEEARKKMERYQEMIQEQNEAAADLQSQISILREKNAEVNEKYFVLELEKRNIEVKLQELSDVIGELDAEVLQRNKKINEKNAHFLQDALQKMESAIVSLPLLRNPSPSTSTAPSATSCR